MKKYILCSLLLLVFLSACEKSPRHTGSQGKQLLPPVPLTAMVLVDDQNNALPVDLLQRDYHYVLLADAACDEFCLQYLELSRFAIEQAKVSVPVKQLLILGYEPDKAWLEQLKQANPGITVAVLTRPIWAIFTLPFNQVAADMLGSPLFLVDPRGFIVMAYDELNEAGPLVDDLQALANGF